MHQYDGEGFIDARLNGKEVSCEISRQGKNWKNGSLCDQKAYFVCFQWEKNIGRQHFPILRNWPFCWQKRWNRNPSKFSCGFLRALEIYIYFFQKFPNLIIKDLRDVKIHIWYNPTEACRYENVLLGAGHAQFVTSIFNLLVNKRHQNIQTELNVEE